MHEFRWTALATIGVVVLLFATAWLVGWARGKYKIKAPATTGHSMFDRAFRVQMNTAENALALLPVLWLFALFLSDAWAAGFGVAWLLGRVAYAVGYMKEPAKREAGFTISSLAWMALTLGSAWGVLRTFL